MYLFQANRLGTPFGATVQAADAYERDLCNFVDVPLADWWDGYRGTGVIVLSYGGLVLKMFVSHF